MKKYIIYSHKFKFSYNIYIDSKTDCVSSSSVFQRLLSLELQARALTLVLSSYLASTLKFTPFRHRRRRCRTSEDQGRLTSGTHTRFSFSTSLFVSAYVSSHAVLPLILVFIGSGVIYHNLGAGTKADDLYPLFDRYGKVVDVFIPRDRR